MALPSCLDYTRPECYRSWRPSGVRFRGVATRLSANLALRPTQNRAGSQVADAVTHYKEVSEFTYPRISAAPRACGFRQNRPAESVARATSRTALPNRIYNVREPLDSDLGAAPNASDAYRGANN